MNKKILILIAVVAVLACGGVFYKMSHRATEYEEIPVESSNFLVTVPASGTVQPENRIQIISPIAGRIDRILMDEGDAVKRNEVLSWMSSTDRAALLDSAQTQGEAAIKEMSEIYKPTPVLSPVSGVIILKNIVVGQTVSQSTVLYELSDRLIVMADVDETDLGKIHEGQEARVTVDSFADLVVKTKVARIAHQSQVKQSINTYPVTLIADKVPDEFRSGLTASVQFVFKQKPNALLLPTRVAEGRENFSADLQVKGPEGKPVHRTVKFGLSNGRRIEALEGLQAGDVVLVKKQQVLGPKATSVMGLGAPGAGAGRKK